MIKFLRSLALYIHFQITNTVSFKKTCNDEKDRPNRRYFWGLFEQFYLIMMQIEG